MECVEYVEFGSRRYKTLLIAIRGRVWFLGISIVSYGLSVSVDHMSYGRDKLDTLEYMFIYNPRSI